MARHLRLPEGWFSTSAGIDLDARHCQLEHAVIEGSGIIEHSILDGLTVRRRIDPGHPTQATRSARLAWRDASSSAARSSV